MNEPSGLKAAEDGGAVLGRTFADWRLGNPPHVVGSSRAISNCAQAGRAWQLDELDIATGFQDEE